MKHWTPSTLALFILLAGLPGPWTGKAPAGELPAGVTLTPGPSPKTLKSTGGTGTVSFTLTGAPGTVVPLEPEVSDDVPWLAIEPPGPVSFTLSRKGVARGKVKFRAGRCEQSLPTPRQARIDVGGVPFTVAQNGAPCTVSITPAKTQIPSGGGDGWVVVQAPQGCEWRARPDPKAAWIAVGGGTPSNGAGIAVFSAPANDTGKNRTGAIQVVTTSGAKPVSRKHTVAQKNKAVVAGPKGNRPPEALSRGVETMGETPAAIHLFAKDTNGNPLSYRVVESPTHGALAGTAPDLVYTPAGDFDGEDRFTFVANDGRLDSNVATLSITVSGPTNQPPTAAFTAAPQSGSAPLEVAFDATDSSDPDGAVTAYGWDFGDGATATGLTVSHTYTAAGTYAAGLVVTDDDGASSLKAVRQIAVRAPSTPAAVTLGTAITDADPNPVVSSAAGVGEGTGSTRTVPVSGSRAQAIMASTADGRLLGLSIATPPGSGSGAARAAVFGATLDPTSTALTLLYLLPGMLPTSDGALIREFDDAVQALPGVQALASALQAQLATRGSLDLEDAAIRGALRQAALEADDLLWLRPEPARVQKIFRPTEQYGLELKDQKAQEGATLLKLANSASRPWEVWSQAGDAAAWIEQTLVWPAKTGDPTSLTDLVGALRSGLDSLIIGTEETQELTVPLDADGRGRLTGYASIPWAFFAVRGLASLDPTYQRVYQDKLAELTRLEQAGLRERLRMPTLMHTVTLQVIPLAEVISGVGIVTADNHQIIADLVATFVPRMGSMIQKAVAGNTDGAASDAEGMLWDLTDGVIKLVAANVGENWLDSLLRQVGRPVALTVFGVNQLRTVSHQFASPLVVEFIAGGSRIAFASEREDGFRHIYVRADDGSGEMQLTSGAWDDMHPVWSPDGSRIAFLSNRADQFTDLYVMNADGSGVRQLTSTPGLAESDPAWSPSGEWLVYVAQRWIGGHLLTDVYSMAAEGGGEVKLTDTDTSADITVPHGPASPSWSAGNGYIYLQMTAEMKVDDWLYLPFTDIYNISPGGASTRAVRITNPDPLAPRLGPSVNHPAVSPDGTRILCAYSGSGSGYDLALLDMTGAEVMRLTNTPGQIEDRPAWSPDGQLIVYRAFNWGAGSIQGIDADGANLRYVTLSQYDDSDPSVGPAGLLPPAAAVP